MEETANLRLPYIMPSQAQKHVTHNEALRALDAMVQLAVKDRDLPMPPADPDEGDCFIVATGADGAWAGEDGKVAAWQDGGWNFLRPREGWRAWIADEGLLAVFDGSGWKAATGPGDGTAEMFGINAAADETNRLAISSPASLFDHEDGDHRLKINKAAAARTASVLFQSNYGGRAEMGLTGSDDWTLKVSADGANWHDCLTADRESGRVRFPVGLAHAQSRLPLSSLIFPADGFPVPFYRGTAPRTGTPRTASIASVSGDVITLSNSAAGLFFHGDMRGKAAVRIWNESQSPEQAAWVKWDISTNQLQVTEGAQIAAWAAGDTIRLGDPAAIAPAGGFALDISQLQEKKFGTPFRQAGLVAAMSAEGSEGQRVGLAVSGTAAAGSFLAVRSTDSGKPNSSIAIVATPVASPISNSNLVFVSEEGTGADPVLAAELAVIGFLA